MQHGFRALTLAMTLCLALAACDDDERTLDPFIDPACVSTSPVLQREAGFITLEQPFGPSQPNVTASMFYAFQPADSAPDCKPLMMIFQGGPFSGMGIVWGGNTGAVTLDPTRVGSQGFADNPLSWTRFANLLYVDSPYAGFSYIQGASTPEAARVSGYAEAATFLRTLAVFVERHSVLARVPVALVGESYGGYRAMLMLAQLLHHDALRDYAAIVPSDPALADILERYLRTALGQPDGKLDRRRIGKHFAQVLIQPFLIGSQNAPRDEPTPVRQRYLDDGDRRFSQMIARLVSPEVLRAITGVPLEGMQGMYASVRVPGLIWEGNRMFAPDADEAALSSIFGALPTGIRYYTFYNPTSSALDAAILGQAEAVLRDVLQYVPTLITNSPNDYLVPSANLSEAVQYGLGVDVDIEQVSPRIEEFVLHYKHGKRRVRFPRYDQSGHAVSLYEPELLTNDIREWLESLD